MTDPRPPHGTGFAIAFAKTVTGRLVERMIFALLAVLVLASPQFEGGDE